MMVSAVIFGVGATAVLAIEPLSRQAAVLLPVVVILSFALAPIVAWQIAPLTRALHSRQDELKQRLMAKHAARLNAMRSHRAS